MRSIKLVRGIINENYSSKYVLKKKYVFEAMSKHKDIAIIDNSTKYNIGYEKLDKKNISEVLSDTSTQELIFFYNFLKLSDYSAYQFYKTDYIHYIIFDNNSDTVYHRILNLTF